MPAEERKDPESVETEPGLRVCDSTSKLQQGSPVTPAQSRARGNPQDEAPFIWIASSVLECIRSEIGQTTGATAIAVYTGLACIANSKRAPRFQAKISVIATASALGYRATQKIIILLRENKLIQVEDENNPKGATYTLLSYSGTGGGKLLRHKKHRVAGGTPASKSIARVPTGLNNSLSKEKERENKRENKNELPIAASSVGLSATEAAGVADTRPAAVKPQPRRW